MNQFEKITESIETLAEYLSSTNKGDNKGCAECDLYAECEGKETCKRAWMDALSSKV